MIQTEVRQLSPRDAEQLLRSNTRNRPINERRVEDLVHIIQSGQWRLTHQGIALDHKGVLQDGQHRLMAISRAGAVVPLMVSTLDENVFDVIDTGRPRNPRDVLALAGIKWANRMPPAIRLVEHYRSSGRDRIMGGTDARLSNRDFLLIAQRDTEYEKWASASEHASHLLGRRGLASPLLSAMVIIDQDTTGLHAAKSSFVELIGDPVLLTEGSPLLALRRWLVVTVPTIVRGRGQVTMWGVIRAWNAYVEQRPLHRIQVNVTRDGAPEVSSGKGEALPLDA